MSIDQEERTVVTREPGVAAGQQTTLTERRGYTRTGLDGLDVVGRVVIFAFGLIQAVIVARIVLLLLDAREGNAIVATILDVSQWFVAPFEGILRTNSLTSSGSVLDIAAIVAFVGWTILELIVLWALRIFRRSPA